jgi:hypothetical protein
MLKVFNFYILNKSDVKKLCIDYRNMLLSALYDIRNSKQNLYIFARIVEKYHMSVTDDYDCLVSAIYCLSKDLQLSRLISIYSIVTKTGFYYTV